MSATTVILDAHGRPVPPSMTTDCPRCGAAKTFRQAAGGFGVVAPCCGKCGYVFQGEVWRD